MRYLLAHAGSLAALLVTFLSAGRLVERAVPHLFLPSLENITRILLGMTFWMAWLFVMAATGLLTPAGVRLAAATVVLAAVVVGIRFVSRRHPLRSWRPWRTEWWPHVVPIGALACVFPALFVLGLRPSPAWDASTYHLTIPRLYLEHGGFRPIQFNVYSNWPLNQELLFALGMGLHDYLLATLIQWIFAGLIVWGLAVGCRVAGRGSAGPLAACLFLANEVVLFEAGVAYVDLGLTFFFLMALVYLLAAERTPAHEKIALLLAGVSCGVMAGIKLIGLFGAVIIAALWLWRSWRRTALPAGLRDTFLLVVLPAALLALPWYVKAAWYTGNPIYPFFYDFLRGDEWSRRLGEQFQAWQSSIGMGRTTRDYLLLPFRLALEGGAGYHRFDGRIAWTWLIAVPLVIAGCWRDVAVRRAAAAALLYFVMWAATSQQARFFIPALAALSLAAAVSLDAWLTTVSRPWMRRAALAICGGAAAVLLLKESAAARDESRGWLARMRAYDYAVLDDASTLLDRFINEQLPGDARVLLLNLNKTFFIRREVVADSFFEASQINAFLFRNRRAIDIAAVLRQQGFTHVLVGRDGWGIPYPSTLTEFLARRTDVIYKSAHGDVLHEIRRP